jgi:hypothetical protein
MFWLMENVRSASDGFQSEGNREPFFGEGVTFSFFNSDSDSDWLGFGWRKVLFFLGRPAISR